GRGDRMVAGDIGLTPRAKKVIELTVAEARRLNHHYVGTEHLLLGVLREGGGIATGILESLGLDILVLRGRVVDVLNTAGSRESRVPAHIPGELAQVLPLGQAAAGEESELTLLSLELYENGIVVNSRLRAAESAAPRRHVELALE